MMVAHGPCWLQEILWDYRENWVEFTGKNIACPVVFHIGKYDYDPSHSTVYLLLKLKGEPLEHLVKNPTAGRPIGAVGDCGKSEAENPVCKHRFGNYPPMPEHIANGLSNLQVTFPRALWEYRVLDSSTLSLQGKVPDEIQNFDGFLRSVVKRLREGSTAAKPAAT